MTMLSAVVITLNEEKNISRCLESVRFADEIVVIDSGSTDNTKEIARSFGARVIDIEWNGFGPAKRTGVREACGDWILSVDADEELTEQLSEEIMAAVRSGDQISGYEMKRRTRFLGRWIYHCGWYPDYILRLYKKGSGGFSDALVHEGIEVSGEIRRLSGEILHYSYPTIESYFNKFGHYTTLAAQEKYEKGARAGLFDILMRPPATFLKHYVINLGFLDGMEGFLISMFSSGYVLTKYAKLRQLQRRSGNGNES